jgi:hypothetical protein
VTFDAKFAFAGAIDLASATLTIDALLSEDEEGGAGELVQGIPIVLHAQPGSGSSAATFATPPRATPSITVDVQMEQPSFATVAMTVLRATLPRFPQLCSLASLPPTTNLTTRFTIDDGINPAVTIATQEPWRCRGLIPDPVFPLQPDSLKTP